MHVVGRHPRRATARTRPSDQRGQRVAWAQQPPRPLLRFQNQASSYQQIPSLRQPNSTRLLSQQACGLWDDDECVAGRLHAERRDLLVVWHDAAEVDDLQPPRRVTSVPLEDLLDVGPRGVCRHEQREAPKGRPRLRWRVHDEVHRQLVAGGRRRRRLLCGNAEAVSTAAAAIVAAAATDDRVR
jgi:hypothetical protein